MHLSKTHQIEQTTLSAAIEWVHYQGIDAKGTKCTTGASHAVFFSLPVLQIHTPIHTAQTLHMPRSQITYIAAPTAMAPQTGAAVRIAAL
jgi:hypothetical protein